MCGLKDRLTNSDCFGGEGSQWRAVTDIVLTQNDAKMRVGEEITLVAIVNPSNATDKAVTWSSSNNGVATVSDGVVTAVAVGTATITVTTNDGGKSATCTVTVSAAQTNPDPTPTPDNPPATGDYTVDGTYVLDIENGADSTIFTTSAKSDDGGYNNDFFKLGSNDYIYVTVKLPANKEIIITGTARPTNNAKTVDLNIALSSDSTGKVSDIGKDITCNDVGVDINKVITVTEEGEIKLVFKRSTTKTGCEITSLSVTIGTAAPVAVESVSLNKAESALKVGESETLTATVAPSNASDKTVTWASSDSSVVAVVNGVVTALKTGTATITATTADGNKTASCAYTVSNIEVESVSFATSGTKTAVGDTVNLTVTVLPENATVKTVTYTSSNTAIATVDNNGKVTAKAVGTAIITAKAGNKTATYSVEVLAEIVKVTGVSLNVTSGTLNTETEEKTVQLNPVIAPSNATNKNVIYSSSNSLVASVDKNGLVTAHQKSGTAVITVTTEDGEKTATYTLTVEGPAVTANTPEITKVSADELETAYVEWTVKASDIWFNAYYMADNGSTWTKLDAPLIRQYETYYRADTVGLKVGTYKMKIVPVVGGKEVAEAASIANGITVKSHDRSGFAFEDGHVPGAYNADGTLKENAIVVYVTEKTKNTVTATLKNNKSVATEYTGLYNILHGLTSAKGVGEPVAIRLIGNITDPTDLDKGDVLVDAVKQGLTIEGIGNDATANGWGIRIKNSTDVEVRNIGFMNCDSTEGDNLGLQQGNAFVWVHNCDMFYGDAGSDADQVKGDGALDTKTSTNVTHSYNHFWDNGKCNLQGMKSEKEENYITYHHNWYDHSDSRHPRIRTCTVHIYNNYFDGNAKYGVGVTMGASAFVENNYFRSTSNLKPMLSSEQGTDAAGAGTFSSETGGIIKSFNNIYDVSGGGTLYLRTYQEYGQDSDCYQVTDRNQTVPSSVTTVKGGTKYNNFDTSSTMYTYTAESPEQAKLSCQRYAGRIDGGDFKWTFNNSVDDASDAVNAELKAALVAYKDKIVKIGS